MKKLDSTFIFFKKAHSFKVAISMYISVLKLQSISPQNYKKTQYAHFSSFESLLKRLALTIFNLYSKKDKACYNSKYRKLLQYRGVNT